MLKTVIINATCYDTEDLRALWLGAVSFVEKKEAESTPQRSWYDRFVEKWDPSCQGKIIIPERITFAYYANGNTGKDGKDPHNSWPPGGLVKWGGRTWWGRLDTEVVIRISRVASVFRAQSDLEELSEAHGSRPERLPLHVAEDIAEALVQMCWAPHGWWLSSDEKASVEVWAACMAKQQVVRIHRAAKSGSAERAKAARYRVLGSRARTQASHSLRQVHRAQLMVDYHTARMEQYADLAEDHDPTISVMRTLNGTTEEKT